jgi:NAD-dependent SIR2 family protein deacetylase
MNEEEFLFQEIKRGKYKKITFMVGSGISVASGIPDFRSKEGIFERLREKCKGSEEELIIESPEKFFYDNVMEFLNMENIFPNENHQFMKKIHDMGYLTKIYTQNIDSLESKCGIPKEKISQVHGNLDQFYCIKCQDTYSLSQISDSIWCKNCMEISGKKKLIRPNIVFYGENINMFQMETSDFRDCDLLFIMGTSLKVYPFASFVDKVGKYTKIVVVDKCYVELENYNPYANMYPNLEIQKQKKKNVWRIYQDLVQFSSKFLKE